MGNVSKANKDFIAVRNALNRAKKAGLEIEVVLWALKLMKENPALTIAQAIAEACDEWDV